jgi:small subunit ribosomal protein S17
MKEQKRVMIGRVLSNRMDKTVVIEVQRAKRHQLYEKVVVHRKKYKAHDEDNACEVGDWVRVIEARPMSREKRWVVTEILERA